MKDKVKNTKSIKFRSEISKSEELLGIRDTLVQEIRLDDSESFFTRRFHFA